MERKAQAAWTAGLLGPYMRADAADPLRGDVDDVPGGGSEKGGNFAPGPR
jgi:hypothetical protein